MSSAFNEVESRTAITGNSEAAAVLRGADPTVHHGPDFDAIVIGSGIGGLGAAALLARSKGWRVLVLERHYEIGGLTHAFRRGSFSWDVGLHYVGGLEANGLPRRLIDYVTGGAIEWRKMTEDFERVMMPGVDLAIPSDSHAHIDRLAKAYPAERDAISRYFRDVVTANAWLQFEMRAKAMPSAIRTAMSAVNSLRGANAKRTTADYLDKRFISTELKALLTYCWGDYGVTPATSSFAVHSLIVNHYRDGGYYPGGGPERIARLAERAVEDAGGAVLIESEALEILVEDGGARGVRVRHARMGDVFEYRSPVVISDVGLLATYGKLIRSDAHPAIPGLRWRLARLDTGASAVQVFLGLKATPETLGVRGENLWLFDTLDHEQVLSDSGALLGGNPLAAYVSFPSIKAGDGRTSTAEIIALVKPEAFDQWRDDAFMDHGPEYRAMKERLAAGLIGLVDRHVPGFADLVVYAETATPLSLEHYTGRAGGRMYGLAATPASLREKAIGPTTPISGLNIAGNDAGSLGVVGALMGGFLAVARSVGLRGTGGLMRSLAAPAGPIAKRRLPSLGLPNEKITGTVVGMGMLAEDVLELTLMLDRGIEYAPGQYMRVEVTDLVWRDYSIANVEDRRVKFLIAVGGGGDGARSLLSAAIGDEFRLRGPIGDFTYQPSGRPILFVATGTGIAPILPMLDRIFSSKSQRAVRLYFGSRRRDAPLLMECKRILGRLETMHCMSAEDTSAQTGEYAGRVTDGLRAADLDWADNDVYVAGNVEMVRDVSELARQRGAATVHAEHF